MKETRFTTNPQKEKLHFDALRFGSWSFVHPTSTPLILNYVSTPTNWLSVEFSEKVSALTSRRREQVKPVSLRKPEFCIFVGNVKKAADLVAVESETAFQSSDVGSHS
ncbi:unnamed protein product [Clavelina lepadiformis]|uniref:Uncharacterized protein n=1 Tax=Clavelina lepadiformis TaxID=159417 RepID=A0ABP0G5Q5_CLALP